MDKTEYKELKAWYKECFDDYDPYGSNINAAFTVANEIHHRGEQTPSDWQYKPSICQGDTREHDDYLFEICERVSLEVLEKFGSVLLRYDDKLRLAGKDY